jgi:hypothetical protein
MPDRVGSHFESGWRLFKSHASVFVVSMLLLFLSWVVLVGIGLVISFPVSLRAIAGFYRSLQPATV